MSARVEFIETSRLWRGALPARSLARGAIAAAAAESGVATRRGAEVCVHLACDAEVQALNARWRGKDAPTNVLSFPAVEPARLGTAPLLGDVFVAFETLAREAVAERKSLRDHFSHLVVHGFLHLVGFDHVEDREAEAMEATEIRALARLGVADPYAGAELEDAAT
jgi:probable rRNA maturation factor